MTILITGVAGFIGMHTALRLLKDGHQVLGIDNLNDYYDPSLKLDRLAQLEALQGFAFQQIDVSDSAAMSALFEDSTIASVVHLAAQAGVRYSIKNPQAYAQSNLVGFLNVLECCRHHDVQHLVYASSSSVYGGNIKQPFAETDLVDHPVSFYAATKKANELMAYSYSHLYGLATTGLRFFTVYGPWGRPDMAYYSFTKAVLAGEPIDVFNHGDMKRDFTYIDDIVEGVLRVLAKPPGQDTGAPAKVFNIGNHTPVRLLDFIALIEKSVGREAVKRFLPMQDGDVPSTYADVTALADWVGFKPDTDLAAGIDQFVKWYRAYYKV
jgi:UDP-glucuronate 4-epimerase